MIIKSCVQWVSVTDTLLRYEGHPIEVYAIPDDDCRLNGKVAVVTGASRGIGFATAVLLAEHGAVVIVSDIDENGVQRAVKCIKEKGGNAFPKVTDVSKYEDVESMVCSILLVHKQIDILVNNAGILRRRKTIEEIPDSEWDEVMAVNVKGVFNCAKAVIPTMKARRTGKIINISSSAGRSVSELGGAHYTTSKTAVLGLTRHLVYELAPYNINVNAICPGLIDTPMIRESTTEEELEIERQAIPMGRFGTPEETAQVVLFLVSEASTFVNGATIDLNGASLLV